MWLTLGPWGLSFFGDFGHDPNKDSDHGQDSKGVDWRRTKGNKERDVRRLSSNVLDFWLLREKRKERETLWSGRLLTTSRIRDQIFGKLTSRPGSAPVSCLSSAPGLTKKEDTWPGDGRGPRNQTMSYQRSAKKSSLLPLVNHSFSSLFLCAVG